jgi:hypothetical protein
MLATTQALSRALQLVTGARAAARYGAITDRDASQFSSHGSANHIDVNGVLVDEAALHSAFLRIPLVP